MVASAVGGIPDLVQHERTGLLVSPREPKHLADALERVINDAGLRRRLIAAGYALAQQHTAEAFLRQVVNFIRERVGVDLLEQEAPV